MQITFEKSVSGLIQAKLKAGDKELMATASTVEGAIRNLAFEVKQSALETELARHVK